MEIMQKGISPEAQVVPSKAAGIQGGSWFHRAGYIFIFSCFSVIIFKEEGKKQSQGKEGNTEGAEKTGEGATTHLPNQPRCPAIRPLQDPSLAGEDGVLGETSN